MPFLRLAVGLRFGMAAFAAAGLLPRRLAQASACAALLLVVMLGPARAQAPAPQPPAQLADPQSPPAEQPAAAAPEAPSPSSSGGLIDKLGGMIKDSVDSMSSNLKGTQQTIEEFNKGAVDTLTRLPVTGFANGRAVCLRSENGAPDCRAASDKLCQAKGYKSGRGLATETAETCNPRIFLPGYQRKQGDCRTDSYVTQAACN
jgi:hypothetical protein